MRLDPLEPPRAPLARISARSRRQAMDWSLVLASQGIEPVIEQTEEAGWALVVAARDYETSLTAIRQYRWENRRWPWRSPTFKSGFVFDWGSAAWIVLTVVFYWLSDTRASLRTAGIMDGAAVAHGEWWRLFTATLLHADLGHLATNAVFGFLLVGLAMGQCGTGVGLLAAYLAGAEVLSYHPVSALVDGQGLNITVMSYRGNLYFGLIACRRLVPDLEVMAGYLREELDALTAAANSAE